MSKYISAREHHTGRPDDAGILKKLENRMKGYKETKLNLSDFIRHNNLDMILNNELIRSNKLYFEFLNYDELNSQDVENATSEVKENLTAGLDALSDYDTLKTVFEVYYTGVYECEPIDIFFNMSIDDALDELSDAINDYCSDMFYEWNAEIYQYFIVSEYDAENYWLKYTSYPILYEEDVDIYLVGITHFGMSWQYFSTEFIVYENIK